MEIGPVSNEQSARPPDRTPRNKPEINPAPPKPTDKVEISEDARARLAELADQQLKQSGRDFDPVPADAEPDQVDWREEIRSRIESGFYDQPGVKRKIARKLVDDLNLGNMIEPEK